MNEKDVEAGHSAPSSRTSIVQEDAKPRRDPSDRDADSMLEDVERIIPGYELDMELQSAHRVETRASVRSKATRVMSILSRSRSKKEGLRHEALPVTNLEEGIVGWESQDDPAMPLNFRPFKKWMLVALLSAITLLTPFASSILSPGISSLSRDFGNENTVVGSMTVSIYLLGYVVGPFLLAPLSEIYGRKIVLGAANVFFCAWQIGCALAPNIESLILFRFFTGVGGAGCLTLGGGVIGDLFHPEERGFAMGIWVLGPIIGPTLGPIVGGFVAASIGWRWDFWIVLIIAVIVTVLIEILNSETSHRVLMERKTNRLRKELGRPELRSCYDTAHKDSRSKVLLNGLTRPLKMLLFSPLVIVLSIYISFLYGVLYLLFTTIPTVFVETYGFTVNQTGLVYLAMGFGNILGWGLITLYSDKSVVRLAKANDGVFEPEMRLLISNYFGIFLPITMFWYGWCAYYKAHWMATIMSLAPYGFGTMGVFLPLTTYIVDSYPMYAASAIAANTALRSLVGALLPLAGPPMYASLGLGWGNSLLGFICIAMIPIPMLFYKFGARLRKSGNLKL